ncbi:MULTISPECIES: acyl-CoA thioesterase [Corynebacterium]|uniref:Thioesterase n=1 Tax=Corynebacterium flavescens TaxID=28028 RepID=A0A1L7CNM1_CORFL|nr:MULTISPECIES: thioesterase family protein [Corynebacterium]APT87444.1 thioesterase [Corynebacterium flavescens]KAA8720534.1 acyl-CoA thioesterase [Corynebacterium flavescens]MDN6099048.1 acyl-CoA thioesterase [Corynebacterium flavescens]MDN6198776.1 acyl-CoA thioesterase [Corynebacterium flavescens]MDN6226760.1 acyl-CoA thioesterase [Corynebacterium flavescens]
MTSQVIHTHKVEVRWSDFDMYGHMMNANFVEVAQEARLAFAREHIFGQGLNFIAFVRHLDINYLLPVKWDNEAAITVESSVSRVGTTSYVTHQVVKDHKGNIACVVDCTQVAIDPQTQAPRPLTDEEKNTLLKTPSEAVAS